LSGVPEDSFNSLEKTHLASLRNNTRHSFGDKVAAVKRRSESQIVRHYPDRAGKRGTEERNMVLQLCSVYLQIMPTRQKLGSLFHPGSMRKIPIPISITKTSQLYSNPVLSHHCHLSLSLCYNLLTRLQPPRPSSSQYISLIAIPCQRCMFQCNI